MTYSKTQMVIFNVVLLLGGCSAPIGNARADEIFARFPAQPLALKAPPEVDLQSHPLAYSYRTQIKRGVAAGPNFAGQYTIVEIGCGTACQNLVIVDLRSGRIIDWISTELGSSYTRESRLLILNPDSDECHRTGLCETKDMVLRDGALVSIPDP